MERNDRSTGRILAAASGVIAHNEGRLGKTLGTEDEAGEKLRLRGLWDGEAEARFVGEEIEALVARDKNHDLKQIAILVRTGAQTREFEERFITLGLPYRVVGEIGKTEGRERGGEYVLSTLGDVYVKKKQTIQQTELTK